MKGDEYIAVFIKGDSGEWVINPKRPDYKELKERLFINKNNKEEDRNVQRK